MVFGTGIVCAQKELQPKIGYTPAIDAMSVQRQKARDEQIAKLNERISKGLKPEQMTPKEKQLLAEWNPMEDSDPWSLGSEGCSWYCGAELTSVRASSSLKPQGGNTYEAKNAHDFTLNHAWVEGAKGDGIGEYIEYTFRKDNPTVTTVIIFNGYVKSEKAWMENSRIKKLKMYVNGKPYAILNLKDTKAQQIFDIGKLKNKNAELVFKFEILEVYKGTKWEDTVLSELEFDGTDVHCFAAHSRVAMADGSQKPIEQIAIGDKILSYNFLTQQVEPADVLEVAGSKHHNLVEYDFGDIVLTGTDDHPIYTTHHGWASINPIHSLQYLEQVHQLSIDHEVLGLSAGQQVKHLKLMNFKKIDSCQWTYTITKLSKNNSFFVEGVLVNAEEINEVISAASQP
jgi:hypothetical protein